MVRGAGLELCANYNWNTWARVKCKLSYCIGFFCLQERWCCSLLVCKCFSSCLSWRCAWGKLKIGHAHLWASCLFAASGTAFASPLSPLSVLLLFFFQSSCCYPQLSLVNYLSKSLNQALCVWSVLCWHQRPETGHGFGLTMVHYPAWWETATQWLSTEDLKCVSQESWIQIF